MVAWVAGRKQGAEMLFPSASSGPFARPIFPGLRSSSLLLVLCLPFEIPDLEKGLLVRLEDWPVQSRPVGGLARAAAVGQKEIFPDELSFLRLACLL